MAKLRLIIEELKLSRIIKYILGMLFIAFGVSLMLKSQIGNSSWDTLHYSMEQLFKISFGTATIIVAMTVLIIVIIMNRNFKFALMAIPIVIVGPLIDVFNNLVSAQILPETLFLQIVFYFLGITLLLLGGAFLLISSYPAGVFDELNMAIIRKYKFKSLVPTRVIMELTAVLTAAILGYLAGFEYSNFKFGRIGIGTIIFAFTIGIFLKIYLKLFERIGLNENKQTN